MKSLLSPLTVIFVLLFSWRTSPLVLFGVRPSHAFFGFLLFHAFWSWGRESVSGLRETQYLSLLFIASIFSFFLSSDSSRSIYKHGQICLIIIICPLPLSCHPHFIFIARFLKRVVPTLWLLLVIFYCLLTPCNTSLQVGKLPGHLLKCRNAFVWNSSLVEFTLKSECLDLSLSPAAA